MGQESAQAGHVLGSGGQAGSRCLLMGKGC